MKSIKILAVVLSIVILLPALTVFTVCADTEYEIPLPAADSSTVTEDLRSPSVTYSSLCSEYSEPKKMNLKGGNFPIAVFPDSSTVTEDLWSPSVTYNSLHSEYLVAWQARAKDTLVNIYARRFSSTGTPLDDEFVISQAPGVQAAPSVGYDAVSDQYWITWTDFRSGETGDIYLRRLSSTGELLGSEIVVNTGAPHAYAARLVCGGGRCAVVWTSTPGDGNSHILMRGYSSNGQPFSPVLLLSSAVGVATEPDICFNPENKHFMVVWYEGHSGTGWDIMGYQLNHDLQNFGHFTISGVSGVQKMPRVSYSTGAHRYLVVWQDLRSGSSYDVYGQILAENGELKGGALPIFTGLYHDVEPVVAGNGLTPQFLVTWARDISGAEQFQIYGSFVTGTGGVSRAVMIRDTYNLRRQPAIVHCDGSNEYLVAWNDDYALTTSDILARRVGSDGTLSGTLINVSIGRKGQEAPDLAYNQVRNEYLVVWGDYRSGEDYDLYGRRLSADGARLENEIIIASSHRLSMDPVLVHNYLTDEYLVVWEEVHSRSDGFDIYARRISGDGTLKGDAFLVSRDTGTNNEGLAHIALNESTGEYLVVWHAFNNGLWQIWGQRISSSGALAGNNFIISADEVNTHAPRVAYSSQHNEYLAIWQDFRNSHIDIYGQRINATGVLSGGNFPISTASGNKGRCDLAYDEAGDRYLVTWLDTRTDAKENIYGQLLSGSAALIGENFPIAADMISQIAPSVAYDPLRHEYLVTWWEFSDATDWDIYARRVSSEGSLVEGKTPVCGADEMQSRVQLVNNRCNGEFLMVWQDFRQGTYDIYGQRWFTPSGFTMLPHPNDRYDYNYGPIAAPVTAADPEMLKPLAIGDIAGGTLSLSIGIPAFTCSMDLYIAIYLPDLDPTNIYLFTPGLVFQTLNQGMTPFISKTFGNTEVTLFEGFQLSTLPPGTYTFMLLLAPSGIKTFEKFYFWISSFSI